VLRINTSLIGIKCAISKAKLNTKVRIKTNKWIFGRISCLGHEVLSEIDMNFTLYNFQKARVDYYNKSICNKSFTVKSNIANTFIANKNIFNLIVQQELLHAIPCTHPEFIIIDSFSELTDQLFINKKSDWGFCCNYSDISHSNEFSNVFDSKGLISVDDLENQYKLFFLRLVERYGDTPIIFLHFSTKLEFRQKFKDRQVAILEVIEKLSRSIENLNSIAIDDSFIALQKDVNGHSFPYHYNRMAYVEFSRKIKKILN